MKPKHWIGTLIILVVAYAIGAAFPGAYNKAKAAIGGGAAA
jgi:hypothetical protein